MQALKALGLKPPLPSVVIPWRGAHERPIRRPHFGAMPTRVSVKFWATTPVYLRLSGVGNGATTDWKPEKTAGGVKLCEEEWATFSKCTPVEFEFTFPPEGMGAGAGATVDGTHHRASARHSRGQSSRFSLGNRASFRLSLKGAEAFLGEGKGCVLEWKTAGWMKGAVVYISIQTSDVA